MELAINGGIPIRTHQFPPWPCFDQDEIEAASTVLRCGKVNYWTGEEAREFEREFAGAAGCNYAVAVANGTLALELALCALDIGQGDEVIVSPRTFIASASCVVMRGAVPVMADVDSVSQNITAGTVSQMITPRTKAIICVHLAGWPCDMDPIMELAREHELYIIEDCAQAHGALYKGKPVGSFGDAAAFSFCQDKIMTTGGEGGMLTTNSREIWEKAWSFKDHGKSYNAVYYQEHPPGYRWVHESFGTNWRLTEMQAAIGRLQLKKLPGWVKKRRDNADVLTECFKNIPALRVTEPPEDIEHAFYKYYAFVRPEKLKEGWDRNKLIEAINAEGIPCFSGICPEIYREKAFVGAGLQPAERLKFAKELGETSLMFLVHPTLSEDDMRDTCRVVEKVFGAASS